MQTLEFTAHTTPRIRSNNLKALFSHLSNSKSTTEVVPSSSKKKVFSFYVFYYLFPFLYFIVQQSVFNIVLFCVVVITYIVFT